MSCLFQKVCVAALVLLTVATVQAAPPDMVCVSNGVFRPLFRSQTDLKEVPVKSFYLEVVPVTNEKISGVRPVQSALAAFAGETDFCRRKLFEKLGR
jgi:hypothetical protein